MKSKKVPLILCVMVVSLVTVAIVWFVTINKGCATALPLKSSNDLIKALDSHAFEFASTSKNILGQSSEGGEQFEYFQNDKRQIVEQRVFGETGRSYVRFYYSGDKVVAITKLNLLYAVPISIKSSGEIKATEKKDFYLSSNGTVCRWFLNDAEQKVDGDTIQMVREYISGIL